MNPSTFQAPMKRLVSAVVGVTNVNLISTATNMVILRTMAAFSKNILRT